MVFCPRYLSALWQVSCWTCGYSDSCGPERDNKAETLNDEVVSKGVNGKAGKRLCHAMLSEQVIISGFLEEGTSVLSLNLLIRMPDKEGEKENRARLKAHLV